MAKSWQFNDAALRYLDDVTSRIVAESGNPGDRHHLGKIILRSLHDDPDFVLQIDGATGQTETCGSVLRRSVKCATSFNNFGLQIGDVIVIMAPNHLDLTIPFYAALYNGLIIYAVDKDSSIKELKDSFTTSKPKVVFCQSEKLKEVHDALNEIGQDGTVITFDESPESFEKFTERYATDSSFEEFRPAEFDPAKTISFFVATSGSTGPPKCSVCSHVNIISYVPYLLTIFDTFPKPTRSTLIVSPIQWISAHFNYIFSAIFHITRIQTSAPVNVGHIRQIINEFKPSMMIASATFMVSLIKDSNRESCDLSCFDCLLIGGSAVTKDIVKETRAVAPKTAIIAAYGLSEIGVSHASLCRNGQNVSLRSFGHITRIKLVDINSGNEILDANVQGEMCVKGPSVFQGYYNNPKATMDTFSEDGWFKTGDMFYKDEMDNYYFVDRIKSLLKYRNHQISPVEIEAVIRDHPAVLDVAVTGLRDHECGELPVACVIRRQGLDVTAEEIKKLVEDSLSDPKHLRGGVIFIASFPLTPTTKINRTKLKEIIPDLVSVK